MLLDHPQEMLPGALPSLPDLRLFARFPDGLRAEVVAGEAMVPGRIVALALCGARLIVEPGLLAGGLRPRQNVTLRCRELAGAERLRATVQDVTARELILVFGHDPDSELALTRFLVGRPLPWSDA